MIRGAAIYGCDLPNTEGFAQVISEELTIFLSEFGYSELTVSEMILALHLNACGAMKFPTGECADRVEFSGVCFNIVFMAKILSLYRSLRNQLDRKFQNQIDGY